VAVAVAYLYQQIPPAPTWADLDRVAGAAITFAAAIPGWAPVGVVEGVLGVVGGWVGGLIGQADNPQQGASERISAAVADCQAVREEAASSVGTLPASEGATAKLRRACIVLEQEAGGAEWTAAKSERDRAELVDDVTNPEAYVRAAKNIGLGGFSPLNNESPTNPKNLLPDPSEWWKKYKIYFMVGAGIVIFLLVVPLILGAVRTARAA